MDGNKLPTRFDISFIKDGVFCCFEEYRSKIESDYPEIPIINDYLFNRPFQVGDQLIVVDIIKSIGNYRLIKYRHNYDIITKVTDSFITLLGDGKRVKKRKYILGHYIQDNNEYGCIIARDNFNFDNFNTGEFWIMTW